jgi:hypothetical protein
MAENIDSAGDAPPRWDPNERAKSLESLRQYGERQATKAIGWYYAKKKRKAFWSWYLRFSAVLFSGLGALCPILATVLPTGAKLQTTQLGYVFLGLAAVFVGFDRYTGSSSGWMRYIASAMTLETLLEEFRLRWVRLELELGTGTVDDQASKRFLDAVEGFALAVRAEVEKETQTWIAEFQDSIGQLEKETREALAALRDRAKKEAKEVGAKRIA